MMQHYYLTQDDRDKLEQVYNAWIELRTDIKTKKLKPFGFACKPKPDTTIPGCKFDDTGKLVPGEGEVVLWTKGVDNSVAGTPAGKLVKQTKGTFPESNTNQTLTAEDTDVIQKVYNYTPYEYFPFQFVEVQLTQSRIYSVVANGLPTLIAEAPSSGIQAGSAADCKIGWLTHDHDNNTIEYALETDPNNPEATIDLVRPVRNLGQHAVANYATVLVVHEPGGQLIVTTEFC